MELELRGITKRFGSLVANDRVDLSVTPGQVHALLGENGAGKTTLMNVLYGLLQADEGEILIDSRAVRFGSPKDAIAAGIGMVHQHFMLVPVFTVAENVTLGIEETGLAGLADRRSGFLRFLAAVSKLAGCWTGAGRGSTCASCPAATGWRSIRTRWWRICRSASSSGSKSSRHWSGRRPC